MNKFLKVMSLSLLCGAFVPAHADSTANVVGAWELCVDPDGEPKDVLRLAADGTGKVVNGDGRSISFTYSRHIGD